MVSYNLNFYNFLQFYLNVNKMIFNEELFDKHSNQTAVITSENKILNIMIYYFALKI